MSEEEKKLNTVTWDLEFTHPDLALSLRAALRQVMDPEIGMSIIQLGLVRNASVMDDVLVVSMIMTTPFCPYGPALIDKTKEQAQSVSPFEVTIALGMEPWGFEMMEDPGGFEWGIYR